MVMEAVSWVSLKDVRSQMTGSQHIECVQSIGTVAKELSCLVSKTSSRAHSTRLNILNVPIVIASSIYAQSNV